MQYGGCCTFHTRPLSRTGAAAAASAAAVQASNEVGPDLCWGLHEPGQQG